MSSMGGILLHWVCLVASSLLWTLHRDISQAIETLYQRDESIVSKPGNRSIRCVFTWAPFLAALTLASLVARGQATSEISAANGPAHTIVVALPDGPRVVRLRSITIEQPFATSSATGGSISASADSLPEASPTEKYIEPGQAVPVLSAGDKFLLGFRAAVTPSAPIGWFGAAGYEHLRNDSPNYGTDRGAFGQRLGAAALRDVSEDVFADSFMSPLFREDPRYYQLGPTHNFFIRLVHAGFRPIIGRTDSGRTLPDFANLTGTLMGAALTSAYYPPVNRSFPQTVQTFGWSLGGSAVGYIFREFSSDIMKTLHPQHTHEATSTRGYRGTPP